MKKLNAFTIAVAIIVSFLFVACGGEGPDDPVDDSIVTDDATDTEIPDSDQEPVDNQTDDLVDTEPTDDLTDETPDDDGLADVEPTDDDSTPIPCSEDEICKEVCKNFLDFAGEWSMVEITGDATITLSVENSLCKISVTGRWTFEWKGTEIPLQCAEYTPASYFFYLVGMEESKMVWFKGTTKESCETAGETNNGPKITFNRK